MPPLETSVSRSSLCTSPRSSSTTLAPRCRPPTWRGSSPSSRADAAAHTIAYDGETLGDSMSGKPLSRKRWASVSVPTLVIDGGASPAWLRNAAQAVADLLPNAERRTLEGQTHSVDAKVLAPVLEEFFAR